MNSSWIHKRNRIFSGLIFLILLLLILFFLLPRKHAQHTNPALSLRINEVCARNPGTLAGENTTYEDYIELYNPTEEAISLERFSLSDDSKDLTSGPLPDDIIEPGGYYVIYAVGTEGSAPEGCAAVSFALSENETISLSYGIESEEGNLNYLRIDSVTLPSLSAGSVYARTEDGQDNLAEMRPSPGFSNESSTLVLEAPVFSRISGFYEEETLTVELLAPKGLSIRYTLDGTAPTEDSLLYTDPLLLSDPSLLDNVYSARDDITAEANEYRVPEQPVDKAVVIRAVAFDENGNYSNPVTATYFLGFAEKEGYENAMILSVVTAPDNLFDAENGIYVRGKLYEDGLEAGLINEDFPWIELMDYTNYYLEGTDSERDAHISFYDTSHALAFQLDCGIRIRGNESRNYPQKSFTLFARKRYGTESFAPVFFDSGISYPDLILNNGRQLKKIFFFSLVEDRNVSVQSYQPCQVFLNGEYWGMYYLMEKYSAEYLEGHYGVAAGDSLLIKATREVQEGEPTDVSRFKALREYLKQDMSDPALYAGLLDQMDIQSFIDWMCTNIYIGNTDTKPLGGNVFTWQTTVPDEMEYHDGKWRWMLYDLDDSLSVGIDTSETPAWAIDSFVEHPGYSSCGYLDDDPMPSLMGNEDFRKQFVLTFQDMANENFRAEHVSALLDEIEAQYTPWADKSYARWNTNPKDTPFTEQAEELRTYFNNRFDAIMPCLAEHFELEGALSKLKLSAENAEGGTISLNTLTPNLTAGDWEGQYYTDYPITVSAAPAEGYTFAGWEIQGGEILEGTSSDLRITVQLSESGTTIHAVFEED